MTDFCEGLLPLDLYANDARPGKGRRRQRSTGTHVRKDARRIADEYEAAAPARKTETQTRRVRTDLFKEVYGTSLVVSSVEDFLEDWLKRKEAEASDATANAHRRVARRFLEHLGPRAKIDPRGFDAGEPGDPSRESSREAQHGAEAKKSRRPFTMEGIQKLLGVANHEWCDMILFGLYTGQRLGDSSTLPGRNSGSSPRRRVAISSCPLHNRFYAWSTRGRRAKVLSNCSRPPLKLPPSLRGGWAR